MLQTPELLATVFEHISQTHSTPLRTNFFVVLSGVWKSLWNLVLNRNISTSSVLVGTSWNTTAWDTSGQPQIRGHSNLSQQYWMLYEPYIPYLWQSLKASIGQSAIKWALEHGHLHMYHQGGPQTQSMGTSMPKRSSKSSFMWEILF